MGAKSPAIAAVYGGFSWSYLSVNSAHGRKHAAVLALYSYDGGCADIDDER
jgi:hypothetical protein